MGIIMLTANSDETSKVTGLSNGADDYLVKPFHLRELLARIQSVLRRTPTAPAPPATARPTLPIGSHLLDLEGRRLFDAEGTEIKVTAMEFEILEAFARHPGKILSRNQLCELAFGRPHLDGDRSVDIRMTRLRKKLESDPARPAILRTVVGVGYVLDPVATAY